MADESAPLRFIPSCAFLVQGVHVADDERGNDPGGLQMAGAPVGADHRLGIQRRYLLAEKRRIAQFTPGNDKNHLLHHEYPA